MYLDFAVEAEIASDFVVVQLCKVENTNECLLIMSHRQVFFNAMCFD